LIYKVPHLMARVTVLFATRNGVQTLPRMLDALEHLTPPSGGWKIVAVDNGSTDHSFRVLQQRAEKLPMMVVSEPRRGKNIALNTGLALVEGEIVALTDDDIILPVDWLVSIEKIAAQKADFDIFGGAIYPIWGAPPPEWVLQCVPKHHLGVTEFPEGPVSPGDIWGGSMAVRTAVFREHKFAEGFEMHSETEFTRRANSSGHLCWHFRESPVGHIIRPYQLKPKWHLQRAYRLGRADRREFYNSNEDALATYLMLRQTRWHLHHIAREGRQIIRSRLSGDSEASIKASLALRYWHGCLIEDCAGLVRHLVRTPLRKLSALH
jgi:glycosyltransferase involved in cell wall biosynthesis